MRQILAEPEVYVLHKRPDTQETKPQARSIEDRRAADKAAASGMDHKPLNEAQWLSSRRRQLQLILSTHVDDLKGGARKEIAKKLLAHLEKHGGHTMQIVQYTFENVQIAQETF